MSISKEELKSAMQRILAGERATLVVPTAQLAEAESILAKLPAALRARLTLVGSAS